MTWLLVFAVWFAIGAVVGSIVGRMADLGDIDDV